MSPTSYQAAPPRIKLSAGVFVASEVPIVKVCSMFRDASRWRWRDEEIFAGEASAGAQGSGAG